MAKVISDALDGWKTHLLAAVFAGIAVLCWRGGMITGEQAFQRIEIAVMGTSVRAAVAKIG